MVADPLSVFFTAEALAGITIPVQLWGSEKGGDGVEPKTVEAVNTALKAPHTFTKVENAQHFSFLTVCPPTLPSGAAHLQTRRLDRAQFHDLSGAPHQDTSAPRCSGLSGLTLTPAALFTAATKRSTSASSL